MPARGLGHHNESIPPSLGIADPIVRGPGVLVQGPMPYVTLDLKPIRMRPTLKFDSTIFPMIAEDRGEAVAQPSVAQDFRQSEYRNHDPKKMADCWA